MGKAESEPIIQFITAIFLIYVLFIILKTLNFDIAFSIFVIFSAIGILMVWLLEKLRRF